MQVLDVYMTKKFSFIDRAKSVKYAASGIKEILRSQHNAWIHLVATLIVVNLGFIFGVSKIEWCVLILAMIAVWVAEGLNTAFEFLCDVASPEFHPLVEKSKDVAAGAVLISAIGAIFIGLIIFVPYMTSFA